MSKILGLVTLTRWPLVVALAIGLTGCLISKTPLISRSEKPFRDYVLLQQDQWDNVTREWQLVDNMMAVSATNDGYVIQRKNEVDSPVQVKTIGPRTFLLQLADTSGATYVAVVVGTDGRWYFRTYQTLNSCSDVFSEEQIRRFGLSTTEPGGGILKRTDCAVASLDSLVSAILEDLHNRPDVFEIVYRVIKAG